MSNHFTYEINERNVRMQLKGHKFEAKESDWLRFQEHTSENVSFRKGIKVADKFNITLNRNVILPLVFGIIILAFSLLLVNFMSIKNKNNSLTTAPDQIEKSTSSELNAVAAPEKTAPSFQKQTSSTSEVKSPSNTKHEITSVNDLKAPELAKQTPSNKPAPAVSMNSIPQAISDHSASPSPSVVDETVTKTSEAPAKKRKKTESEETLTEPPAELRPTGVSEDQETEVRPE